MVETEKITVNLNAVDLGKIDLLVQEGSYTNRTDFIRSAIRSQLEKHKIEIQQSVSRHAYAIGVISYDRADLERIQAKGDKLRIAIMGLLHLQGDIPADLAAEVIESLRVRGMFIASEEVKRILADRME